ncbi:MAG: N-acetylmuramoyl-L-alanine amidase family protein [Eubacteriales bacterium]
MAVRKIPHKRRRVWKLSDWGMLLLALAVLAGCFVLLNGRGASRDARLEKAADIAIQTQWVPEGSPGRPGEKREIRYVVIHETGNPTEGADAANHSVFLQSGTGGTTSWHYTVDDHAIFHHIPDDEVAWHAGDGSDGDGNLHGIGVELCVNPDGDFEQTLCNAAVLTAELLRAYDLKLEDVKQHHDFSGKNCPETIRGEDRWEEFLEMVRERL